MALVTESRNPRSAPTAHFGPQGEEFAAYERLPQPSRVAQQLREIQALSHDFSIHLANALSCNPTDLSAMQHLIVSGAMSPGELSQRLGVTTAAGSMVVDRLVRLGHATREPFEGDRRRTVVHPTAQSVSQAIEELTPVIGGVHEVVAQLSDDERAVIERFLDSVIGVYGAALRGDNQAPAPPSASGSEPSGQAAANPLESRR